MLRRRSGQTATEYMLVVSVVAIALVASAYVFVPQFQDGVGQLAQDVSVALATGQIGGIGFARRGGGGLAAAPGTALPPMTANAPLGISNNPNPVPGSGTGSSVAAATGPLVNSAAQSPPSTGSRGPGGRTGPVISGAQFEQAPTSRGAVVASGVPGT